ncbi:hypothetical protein EVJ58_g10760 [Rhodofomes roseus]|uniref:Uncharacterized protein n=1 Tax=Rhodofomes roseus TaxID=34475 RepID=A0A4Y9XMS4_9APHY|nr:hypothetical protein EVJ58_g10760 [Rhodofomes roseus]
MSTSLTDFNSAFDKLESAGKNWLTFQQRFQIAVRQKKVWSHFDGSSPCPIPAAPTAPTQAERTALDTWQEKEDLAMYLLTQKLPDVTFTKHRRKGTVAAIWAAIVQEFSQKSMLLRANLRTQFLNMRSTPGANLHSELDRLRMRYEELISHDIVVSEAEYASLIINFLPDELSTFVSQISATAKLARRFQTSPIAPLLPDAQADVASEETPVLDAEALMEIALEEWDRRHASKAKTKPKDAGVAASVLSSEKPKAKGRRGPQRPVGVCWNCGGKGHRQDQCPSPKQDGAAKGASASTDGKSDASKAHAAKPKGTAGANTAAASTAAVATLDEVAGAWSAFITYDHERDCYSSDGDSLPGLFDEDARSNCTGLTEESTNSMPSLQTVSDSTNSGSSTHDSASDSSSLPEGPDEAPAPEPVPIATRVAAVLRWVDDIMPVEEEVNGETWERAVDEELRMLHAFHALDQVDEPDMYDTAAPATAAALAAAESMPVDLYDSGATHHMSPYRDNFVTFTDISPKLLNAANQQHFQATGTGDMIISVPNESAPATQIRLTKVLYTPALGFTLVSIGCIDDAGYTSTFAGGKLIIADGDGKVIGTIPKSGGLYLVSHTDRVDGSANAATRVEKLTVMELHRRLGHIAPRAIRELVSGGRIKGVALVPSDEPETCEVCIRAKSTRKTVPDVREGERAEEMGEEIHSDLWGAARIATLGGRKHYISFTDDKTRFSALYLLRLKSEAFEAFKAFEAWLENHHGKRVKYLNTDRGGEYLSDEFKAHLEARGIMAKLSVHDTHEEAGVAERLNRTLMEKTRAMLFQSGLPKSLWGEAVLHAVWLKNRSSTKALDGMTPFQAVTGRVPGLAGLPVWGTRVWVHDTSSGKLGVRAKEARWVGFDAQSKGHRVYLPESRRVAVERNVRFGEAEPPAVYEDDGVELEGEGVLGNDKPESTADSTESEPEQDEPVDEPSTPPAPPKPAVSDILAGKSADTRVPRGVLIPTEDTPKDVEGAAELVEEVSGAAMAAHIANVEGLDPRSIEEAKRRPEWPRWQEAVLEEVRALEAHGTWRLERPPPGAKRGQLSIPGVDFFDTYAPVAKMASIRTLLAFAARHDFEVHQVDVKSAYLHGEFEENEVIYMSLPPGVKLTEDKTLVLRLLRPLYGLRQSARHWHKKLLRVLQDRLRMSQCDVDQAVFFRAEKGSLIAMGVHVDDLTIVTSGNLLMDEVKENLRRDFEITDEGPIHWILGLAVERNREARTLSLSQVSYIESIIRRFNLEDAKPVTTPMEPQVHLSATQSPQTAAEAAEMRDVPYREAIGSLMYASLGTRPDITYAVSILSRFSEKPGRAHWDAAKRVFRYLAGTKNLKLTYGAAQFDLVGYSDADGSMHEDRKAISGYAFLIDGGAVSWASKRQEIISLSTTESEYVAVVHASKEALWLRSLIGQVFAPSMEPIPLKSDNMSAISLTQDHQYHARTKHIDIRFHFIRWVVQDKKIQLIYCPTEDMVADTLTKALSSPKVKHFANALGLLHD